MTDITWMQVYLGEILQSTGYTVTMQPDGIGGTVTFDTAPAQDVLVTLLRVVPTTQGIDYTPYDAFPADTAEGGYDKLTFIAQQLEENLSRVPTEPIGAPENPEEGYQHNLTVSRDIGDCHPIAAITGLQTELDTLTSGVGDNAGNISTNAGNITANADAIAAIPEGVGVGQTWQAVTRTAGTPYTNDTGKPIMLNVSATTNNNTLGNISIDIDGYSMNIARAGGASVTQTVLAGDTLIPVGATYTLTQSNVSSVTYSELR